MLRRCSLLFIALILLSPDARASRFATDQGDDFDSALNSMWQRFGLGADGKVIRFGNEPAFFEWMAKKVLWCDDEEYKKTFIEKVREFPLSANGYVWSWGNQHTWPTGDGSPHQENNAKYILAVYRIHAWTRDLTFLNAVDAAAVPNKADPEMKDVSQGMTVLEKARAAMKYQLETLQGAEGLLLMDNGLNTGKADGHPTHYWDNFPFGYRDAYCNIYFYASLDAMAALEDIAGATEEALRLRDIAKTCRDRYNQTFWNETKGRYIGCIGQDGIVRDYGFTFLNLEAICYGLADRNRVRKIYAWLDGERLVEGDTSQGADIYTFKIAPRATTRAVESNGPPFWWFSLNGAITPDKNAAFGEHLENGGAIFYTSYYDVLGRALFLGADNAWDRFGVIIDEFKKDGLDRDPANNAGMPWKLGIVGEFPESGLVPYGFLNAFMGIDADAEALVIEPRLPTNLSRATVDGLNYAGLTLQITVNDESRTDIEILSGARQSFKVKFRGLKPDRSYIVTAENMSIGTREDLEALRTDSNGEGIITLRQRPGIRVTIRPVES